MSKSQHNSTSTKHNLSWVRHENDPTTPPTHRNSMSAVYPLLLTRYWWNLKRRFLGTSRTDSNYQDNICLGNICPGHICPHQKYLTCYWTNFDETLNLASSKHLEQILTIKLTFVQATFVLATSVHIQNFSAVTYTI